MRRLIPTENVLFELITKIYEAALNVTLWPALLDEIRHHCGADQCTLFYYNSAFSHKNIAAAARGNPHIIETYLHSFIELQARQIHHQLALLPEGVVVMDEDIQQLSGDNYSGVVGDNYMNAIWPNLQFQAGAVLKRNKLDCAGIGLQNFYDSPSVTAKQVGLLQSLIPHLVRALDIHQAFANADENFNRLKRLFNQVKQGVVILNNSHEIEFINPAATAIFEKSTKLRTSENRYLHFDQLVKASIQPISLKRKIINNEYLVCIDEPWGKLKISGFHLREKSSSPASMQAEWGANIKGSYILFLQDANHDCNIPFDYLHQAYQITPAECDLINELLKGHSLNLAAREREVTKETARWQLKSIMQKTHTHSQSELSRLILAFCDN